MELGKVEMLRELNEARIKHGARADERRGHPK